MTDNDFAVPETSRGPAVAADRSIEDGLAGSALVVFGADDELACIDDACLPARSLE